MLSMAFFVLASILLCALLWSLKIQASLRSNIRFLQENLDHSRSRLADYDAQVDELNYDVTQLRVQHGSLTTALNKYKKYQDIYDIEQYIINRTLQAENFVEVTKLDASIMIDDLKAYIESVKDYLAQFQAKALVEVEQQARKSLAGYYQQAKQQQGEPTPGGRHFLCDWHGHSLPREEIFVQPGSDSRRLGYNTRRRRGGRVVECT